MPQNDELVAATRAGDLAKVKQLIEAGADPNSVDANDLLNFHPEVTKYLLEQGADKQVAFTHDGKTLLQWLAQFPDDERLQKTVELLK